MNNPLLFETDNPLEERLGKDFFDTLPTRPGVYKMFSREDLLLYVGKAKNLRRRLFTYRRVTSGSGSRKTRRLVRMVRRIAIELCSSEEEALLRENELIRTQRPPFNRAKKTPETYYYISAVPEGEALTFHLRMHRKEVAPEYVFGAFKGHRGVRRALGALLRQLYIVEKQIATPFLLPSRLLNRLTPLHYTLRITDQKQEQVRRFLGGKSDQLLYEILDHTDRHQLLEQFIGKLILKDMEALKSFYRRCALRNRHMVERLELDSHLIPQDKLDDYLVELAFLQREE